MKPQKLCTFLCTLCALFLFKLVRIGEGITRNISRVKTAQDHINEMRLVFKRYPKRQGKRKNGEEPYVRDEKISAALGGKWKGDTMINKLEKILFNDLEGDVLSKGIVEHGWKIDTCHEFLTKWKDIDETNNYGYTDKLVSGELKISEVNKFISDRDFLENEYQDTFVIPEKAESFKINCLDFGKIERYHKKVSLLCTSVPYYFLRTYDNGDQEQNGLEETKFEYCDRISQIFKSLEPTLRDDANVIINIGETYDNGIGLGIPDFLKDFSKAIFSLRYFSSFLIILNFKFKSFINIRNSSFLFDRIDITKATTSNCIFIGRVIDIKGSSKC